LQAVRVDMRMRQSLAELEEAFVEESYLDRHRREELRRRAAHRSRQRQHQRRQKQGTARFMVLVLVIVLTAVVVAVAMFETLYLVMG
jgi:cell division septal protein FtsQ